jgi:hypothetical protein
MKRETIATDFNMAQAFIAKVNVWPLKITVTDDTKKRSLPANAVQHCFYKAIADYTGEDIKTTGHRMKRDIGLPILLAGDNGVKAAWLLEQLKFHNRLEQQQLNMMEFIPVTSLFTSKEHTTYRDNMINYWRGQGVILEYKNGQD